MIFTKILFILFVDIIIISLALRTNIYSNIIVSIKKITPDIIMALINITPLFGISILLLIYFSINPNLAILNTIKVIYENNYCLIDAVINLILFSPFVLLTLSFIYQSNVENKKEENENNIKIEYKRMNISIISNYI